MCVFYEKGRGIIEKKFFENLIFLSKFELTRNDLLELGKGSSPEIINYISYFVEKKDFEFFIYKLNLFKRMKEDRIKITDLLKIIEFNLSQIENLDEGDIISKYHLHQIQNIYKFLRYVYTFLEII